MKRSILRFIFVLIIISISFITVSCQNNSRPRVYLYQGSTFKIYLDVECDDTITMIVGERVEFYKDTIELVEFSGEILAREGINSSSKNVQVEALKEGEGTVEFKYADNTCVIKFKIVSSDYVPFVK